MRVEVMEMARKWRVRVRKAGEYSVVEGLVTADSPYEAFLRFVRRRRIWPKRADVHMEHFPGGHTYWVYPAWRVGNATSIGDRYVARIVPAEEVQG